MVEALFSKAASLDGQRRNADSFQGVNLEDAQKTLAQYGYSPSGKEQLRCGMTGEIITAEIFQAPCGYMRLNHHVDNKVHSRGGDGPRNIVSRQPVEGRSRGGGIRFGEMERDSCIAHGASFFLQDRLCGSSDSAKVPWCRRCGRLAEHGHSNIFGKSTHRKAFCRICEANGEPSTDIAIIDQPFASFLLMREMEAMNIACRCFVE